MFAHLSVFNQDTVPLNIISLFFNCKRDVCGCGIHVVDIKLCHMVIVVIYSIVVSCCVSSSCIGDAQAVVCTLDTYETKKLEIHK